MDKLSVIPVGDLDDRQLPRVLLILREYGGPISGADRREKRIRGRRVGGQGARRRSGSPSSRNRSSDARGAQTIRGDRRRGKAGAELFAESRKEAERLLQASGRRSGVKRRRPSSGSAGRRSTSPSTPPRS
jgi:hypothetical protein